MLTDSKTFLAVLLIALTPAVCLAADGDLDLTFGVGGKVTTHIGLGSGTDIASDVIACQADGKIVIVGTSFDGLGENITVARYHPDGSLDTTFGSDGTVITNLGSDSRAHGVAIQADGRIVVVGQIFLPPRGSFFAVLRYLSDGSLDPSFGSGGVVQPNIGLSSRCWFTPA